jgi:S1-C subfamily serine protease
MRAPVAVAVAALAAAVGAGAAILVVAAADLGDSTTTVVEAAPAPATPNTPVRSARAAGMFDPASLYAARADGVVTIYANLGADGSSQGSGFVADRTGAILTNAHVITNVAELEPGSSAPVRAARAVYVEFSDGERVPAKIVGWDLFSDVAVIRVDPAAHELAPVPLGRSSAVVVGTPVAAIGSPFNEQSSLSVGVVSAIARSIDSLTSSYSVSDAIQTDAPINQGNSGGPLFDARGRVIGINAQIRSAGGTAEGVGFAIPINVARRALDQLVRLGRVSYAYIGIKTQDVTPGVARHFGFASKRGALVAEVEPGTPAAKAGIRGGSRFEQFNGVDVPVGGDVIVRIGKRTVESAQDVSRTVTELVPGTQVPFVLLHGGTTRETVQVTVAERPSTSG